MHHSPEKKININWLFFQKLEEVMIQKENSFFQGISLAHLEVIEFQKCVMRIPFASLQGDHYYNT